jgi:hypothetical protein
MGLVSNHKFMRINTVTHVLLKLQLSYTKSGVGLLRFGFLVCPTRMGGPMCIYYFKL